MTRNWGNCLHMKSSTDEIILSANTCNDTQDVGVMEVWQDIELQDSLLKCFLKWGQLWTSLGLRANCSFWKVNEGNIMTECTNGLWNVVTTTNYLVPPVQECRWRARGRSPASRDRNRRNCWGRWSWRWPPWFFPRSSHLISGTEDVTFFCSLLILEKHHLFKIGAHLQKWFWRCLWGCPSHCTPTCG